MEQSKQQRIRELTDRLNRCRYEYYNLNAPSLTDAEYDALFDELSTLEKQTGFIMTNSPTQTVVKHGRYILMRMTLTEDHELVFDFCITAYTTTILSVGIPSRLANDGADINAHTEKIRVQHRIDERLLCGTFAINVDCFHFESLPPKTFFFQRSPSV